MSIIGSTIVVLPNASAMLDNTNNSCFIVVDFLSYYVVSSRHEYAREAAVIT